jgi:CSLREA domain-containing protein
VASSQGTIRIFVRLSVMLPVVASRRGFSPFRLLSFFTVNLIWLAAFFLAPATAASAQTYTVNTAADSTDAGNCATTCSLRDAITAADLTPGSTVDLTGLGNATITLTAQLPPITANMTISGPANPNLVIVSGGGTVAALIINAPAAVLTTVTMSGFTVANTAGGGLGGYGSGLFVAEPGAAGTVTVNITGMVFSNNSGANGAAITTDGTVANTINLVVTASTFSGNSVTSEGGAIWNGGNLYVTSSTFSSNYAANQGSAILNSNDGVNFFGATTISDSTFANNSTPGSGALYNTGGTLTVHDSTFSGNTPATGGSIAALGTLVITDNIIVESTGTSTGCTSSTVGVCPANPSDPDANGNFDDTAANLKLGSLALHGGLTATLVPQTGSPVICGGSTAGALTTGTPTTPPATLTTDQRGFPADPNCAVNKIDSGSVQVGGSSFKVTTTADSDDGGVCGATCSLRDAINAANTAAQGDIDATGVSGTITLTSELPEINAGNNDAVINITGPGAGSLAVSGNNKNRILINNGTLSITGITLENGNSAATSSGDDPTGAGAILNAASLAVDNTVFSGNTATNNGGAIYSTGTSSLTISNSSFTGNSVNLTSGNGGAIDSAGALPSVTNTTFSANSAFQGAAIFNEGDAAVQVYYDTFANNTNAETGSIFTNTDSAMAIANSTFAGNTDGGGGGSGLYINITNGSLSVVNSLFDANTDCFSNAGPACPTNGTNGNVVAPANSNAGVPALSALGSYGGPTQTILPNPGSSAICGGLAADVPGGAGNGTDQRGFSNASPAAYAVAGCVDSGSVQTDYTAAAFGDASYTGSVGIPGTTPALIVTITESNQNQGGVTVPLAVAGFGGGTIAGNSATTVSGTGATFGSLEVSGITPPVTGTVSVSLPVVGAYTLTAAAENLTINGAGTNVTTTTEATPVLASFVVSTTATNVTLSASVKHTGTAVTEGNITFTVHSGSATGPVIGTAVGPVAVDGTGTAGGTYTIPANQAAATYYVVAAYNDPGGPGLFASSSDTSKTIVITPAVTATQAIATKVLTQNDAATAAFTPVTGSGGVPALTYSISPALPTGLLISGTTGAISGDPTVTLAATVFTVTVKDADNNTATNTFTLTVNPAVTATQSVATVTLTEGVLATPFTPVTGGAGTAPLGFTIAPTLPAGLGISPTTGQITGTPTAALAATVFTVTVTDANLATATNTFTLTVSGTLTANQAVPAIALTLNHAITTGITPVTATGGTTPITWGVAPALPAGLTMSTTTGAITGTPTVAHASSTFTVTVTDHNNATATNTFTLTVNPVVTATQAVATTVLTENHAATAFTPVTGGGGTPALAYSVLPVLPAGLTMSTTTGAITGTPTVTSVATTYTVTVTDANGATATATFSLTVNGPVTATQAVPTITLTINHAATSVTPVKGAGGTPALAYSVLPVLPAGLTMSTTTGAITGTPTVTSVATTYTVTVTDANGATATATFSLTVNGAVTATQSVATTVLTENHAATAFTPVTGGGGTPALTYSVLPVLPAGLTMSTTTGAITGTPTVVSTATTYTVTVTDANGATATATFSLTVNTAVTATQAVATTILTQNRAATAFTPVTGAGGTPALAYSVLPVLPAGLTMSTTTGAITGTPTIASAATTYTVTVTDANNATATATFSLTVNASVTATQAVPTITLTVNHVATAVTPVTGAGGTPPLAYSVLPVLPAGLTMSATTGAITGTPTAVSGATTYTVTVTDANGATATATFSLTVNGAVTATQSVPTTVLTQNHAATAFTPVTGGGGTPALAYSVLPVLPAGLTMSTTTGAITGTPTAVSGATTYTVTVTDANGATATATFSLTVNGAVTATTAIATTTLTENHAATAFTPVTGAGGTAPLVYSVLPVLPAGLTMSTTTGAITGTPTVASAATTYTVTVTDANNATATATFSLTVSGALSATTAIPTTVLTQNHAAAAFTPVTGAGGTAPLAYSVLPVLPAGLTMSSTTGAITGTPTAVSAATTYTVTVTDANSTTATATFSLTVSSAVTATTAIATTTLTATHLATPFTPVTGAGGTAPLHYSVLPALPATLTMNTTTGQITGTPGAASAATVYTVTVTDANGETATATFSLTVSGSVTATTAVPTTVLTENHVATAFTPVTGAGGTAPLAYSVLSVLPAGLTMSTTTGAVTGTPTVVSAATVYTVTVTDADNATATATFSLTVNGALAATTAVPTTTLLAEQAATPFTPVTGAGGTAPLTYGVAPALPAGLTMSTSTGTVTGTPTVTSNATTYTVTVTDANSATATATFSLTVNSAGISITWANPGAITYGTSLAGVLNATVSYNGGAVPGTFAYTATPAGGSAAAVMAATVLGAGSYTLTASFTPTDTTKYSTPAPAQVPLTVNQAQPTLAWTPATTIGYGTSLSALLNATASFGGNAVAGSFAYTATPTGGTAAAVTGATVLTEGTYTLGVTFTPSSTTNYKTATGTSPLTVTGQTLTVSANNTTKVYGTANPTFTGSVTGAVNGDTFTETFSTTATVTSTVGAYPIVPAATGANLSDYTVVVDDGTLTVTQAGTTTTLTASSNSINPGASVTLTATVASATTGTPTGTVSFYNGSTLLGTGTLAAGASGDVATLATTALPSGSQTITAVYGGDANFSASSTTGSVTITVAPLGLILSATPLTQTGTAGTTFTYQLSVAPAFAGTPYPGTVTFAAAGGPTGTVITFSPTSLAANAGPQTVSMSVATSASTAAVQPLSTGRKLIPVAFALFLLPLAGTRRMRRNGQKFSRYLGLLLLALAGVAATTALSGCGSNPGGKTGTSYTINVTATSGSVTQTTAVTVTVK